MLRCCQERHLLYQWVCFSEALTLQIELKDHILVIFLTIVRICYWFTSILPLLYPEITPIRFSLVSVSPVWFAHICGENERKKTEPWKFDAKIQHFFELCKFNYTKMIIFDKNNVLSCIYAKKVVLLQSQKMLNEKTNLTNNILNTWFIRKKYKKCAL